MTSFLRYQTDATFHALVNMFVNLFEHHCGSGAGVTPSEVREASGLAWQIYSERHGDWPRAYPSPLYGASE